MSRLSHQTKAIRNDAYSYYGKLAVCWNNAFTEKLYMNKWESASERVNVFS